MLNHLPVHFRRFMPNYNEFIDNNHDLRYYMLRLPMTKM